MTPVSEYTLSLTGYNEQNTKSSREISFHECVVIFSGCRLTISPRRTNPTALHPHHHTLIFILYENSFACSDFCTQPLNKTLGASVSLRANVVHIAETAHKCAILRPYKHTGQQTAHSRSLTALGYYTHLLMGPE